MAMENYFCDLRKALFGFVKAQLTLVSMTTVIVLIGLLILRVPYAITIAIITGVVDLLPYLGTGAVFVPLYTYFHWRHCFRHRSSHFIHRRDCPKTNYGAKGTFI